MELLVCFAVTCIQAAIADHFKMFLRDMPDQTFDEVHNRDRFLYIFIIFVSIVMKSDHRTIIFVDPGSGDHRTPQIASDILMAVSGHKRKAWHKRKIPSYEKNNRGI